MGQAQIKSHLGGGLYSVAYKFDTQRRDALIAQLDRAIATLDARKAVVGEDLIKVDAEYNALAKANPLPSWDVLYAKRQERNGVIREYRTLDAQLVSLRIKRMDARISPEDETLQAWCADLTEDLSGDVGTIEINGLPGYYDVVKLRPGHGGGAAYDYTRDGIVQKTETADSAAAYWNLAMAPGWQRWRPTFRIAVISNIDTVGDTCTVTLEPAVSQIRPRREDLDINALSVIHGVPVQYMTCNARAFDPGDRVIVEFQDQDLSRPRVIGFADHPKGCGGFRFRLTRGDGLVTSPQNADGFYLLIQSSDLTWSGQISVSGGKCYDTDGNEVPADAVYDSETQEWIFTVPEGHITDPSGYWVTYSCSRGLHTQYPYRYKSADYYKVTDLIGPGTYEDTIPYWYIDTDPETVFGDQLQLTYPTYPYSYSCVVQDGGYVVICAKGSSVWRNFKIHSSVPYRLTLSSLGGGALWNDNSTWKHAFEPDWGIYDIQPSELDVTLTATSEAGNQVSTAKAAQLENTTTQALSGWSSSAPAYVICEPAVTGRVHTMSVSYNIVPENWEYLMRTMSVPVQYDSQVVGDSAISISNTRWFEMSATYDY